MGTQCAPNGGESDAHHQRRPSVIDALDRQRSRAAESEKFGINRTHINPIAIGYGL